MSKKASDRISKKKKKNKLSNYYITLSNKLSRISSPNLVPSSLGTRTKNYHPKDTQTTRSAD